MPESRYNTKVDVLNILNKFCFKELDNIISKCGTLNRLDFNLVLGEPKPAQGMKRTRSMVDEIDAPSTTNKIDSKPGTAQGKINLNYPFSTKSHVCSNYYLFYCKWFKKRLW